MQILPYNYSNVLIHINCYMFRALLPHHRSAQLYKTVDRSCHHLQQWKCKFLDVWLTETVVCTATGASRRFGCVHGEPSHPVDHKASGSGRVPRENPYTPWALKLHDPAAVPPENPHILWALKLQVPAAVPPENPHIASGSGRCREPSQLSEP